jgi:transglutaminase-like putative cysteine protease
MIRYHVRHDTVYRYEHPVRESHQLLRLFPRTLPWQRCIAQHLGVSPEPDRSQAFTDPFGNGVRALHFEHTHEHLEVRSECWIELDARPMPAFEASPPWESVREAMRYRAGQRLDTAMLEAAACLFESPEIRIKRAFADYAAPCFTPGRPVLAACDALMRRIHADFTFDPEATDVATPVTEVFANRRGVCQDFAHFMISCLRSQGLAARYVSGYLLTRPPPGKPRLIGADATHAWISLFVPGTGWLDFDPTNALWVDQEHVTIGWGRDFSDVSPMRGVLLGGGGHRPEISVTVVPEDEFRGLYTDAALPGLDLLPRGA